MLLHHELSRLMRRVQTLVCGYTVLRGLHGRCQAMSDGGKGRGEKIREGVVIYKDAVPKTGTKLTEKRIAKRFRSLTRSSKRHAAG